MNELKQINAFREILTHYKLSDAAKQTLAQTKLVLLVGPTSSGKNTILRELLQTGKYHPIVSDTTRKPRINDGVMEQNGLEYWFRSEDEILQDLSDGNFLEAAVIHNQQVSGISMRELTAATNEHKIAIAEIEVVGVSNVQAAKPDTVCIFIVPPSFDEWMVRMRGRGELPSDEVRRRLEAAVFEIDKALNSDYYHFVVNDTYKHAARDIEALSDGDSGTQDNDRAREIAMEIIEDTKKYLAVAT